MKYGNSYSNPNWNVRTATNSSYVNLVYNGLIKVDRTDGSIKPALATSWKQDGDSITFQLRPDVTFTDGTPFDSSAVKANIEQLQGPDAGSEAGQFDAITAIDASAPDTVVLTLKDPPVGFLARFGDLGSEMISPKAIKDGSYKTTPVGTGPYQYVSTKSTPGVKEIFTKNANYWDAASQHATTIEMDFIADVNARLNALRSGQVDVAEIAAGQAPQAVSAGMKVVQGTSGYNMMKFLDRSGVLGNVNVRRAMCSAIDTKSMIAAQFGDFGATFSQLAHKGWPGYDPSIKGYTYDPAAAKKYLADAGNPSVNITLPLYGEQDLLGQVLKQNLAAVGIRVTLVQLTNAQYFTTYLKGKYPLVYVSQSFAPLLTTGPYGDYQYSFAKDAPGNPFHTDSPELDGLAAQVQAADNGSAAQNNSLKQMSQSIYTQAYDCGYYASAQVAAYNPKALANVAFVPWSPHELSYGAIKAG